MKGKSRHFHFAWMVCAGCALLMFCTGGLTWTAFSTYLPYFATVKGLAQTQISVLQFARNLSNLIGMVIVHRLIARCSIRQIAVFSLSGCVLSFTGFACGGSYLWDIASAVLGGFSYGIGSMIIVSVLIARWFVRARGIALGACMASTGMATFFAAPVITWCVERFSLRGALLAEAAFVLAAMLPVWLALPETPALLGLQPLGIGEGEDTGRAAGAAVTAPRHLYLAMQIGILVLGAAANNVSVNLSLLYQSVGFGSYQISAIISLYGISLAAGKLLFGTVSDRKGVGFACGLLFGMLILGNSGCVAAQMLPYIGACIASILLGAGCALNSVAVSTYACEVSSEQDRTITVSRFQSMQTLGGLLFSPLPGILADLTGGYLVPYQIMLLLIVASSIILQCTYAIIKAPKPQARPR